MSSCTLAIYKGKYSFVEQVPIILINGAPTNKEDQTQQQARLLYSHANYHSGC